MMNILISCLSLIGISIFALAFAEIEARLDARNIPIVNKKFNYSKSIDHKYSAALRIVVFTLIAVTIYTFNWLYSLVLLIHLLLVFWIFFEIKLNKYLGNDMFYVGNTADLDKLARKVLGNNVGVKLFIIKLVLCISSSIGSVMLRI